MPPFRKLHRRENELLVDALIDALQTFKTEQEER